MPANAEEYIQHHLMHWQWNHTGDVTGFWTFNLDTILVSIFCGLFFLGVFYHAARKSTVHNPSRFQIFIESIVLMVDGQVTEILHKRDSSVSALALSVFVWIWLMNFMDLIPVDLLPVAFNHLGVGHFRAVPTADLSLTLALSLSVLLFVQYEGIKSHGLKKFTWDILSHPFPAYCFPVNIFFRLLEDLPKSISLAMRLFGNMFSGEIIFFLIALTPIWIQWLLGWFWLGFHVFIITLQSFIFMVLTVVYIGIAKNSH